MFGQTVVPNSGMVTVVIRGHVGVLREGRRFGELRQREWGDSVRPWSLEVMYGGYNYSWEGLCRVLR